ncbi:hypothetical protein SAMN04489841_1209 [Natrinema salaciae]|uniref:Uncharacterized protein n=1 Tax=Natrinema salaciae TaxID=1186196 RepID=A0A1H9D1Z1_9EURY|nr:hypothetical protein SAMN04489841_1209 [Natrinema salaciae]
MGLTQLSLKRGYMDFETGSSMLDTVCELRSDSCRRYVLYHVLDGN